MATEQRKVNTFCVGISRKANKHYKMPVRPDVSYYLNKQ